MTIRPEFTLDILSILNDERNSHPASLAQRCREAMWLKSHNLPHTQIAKLVVDLRQHRTQRFRCDRIEEIADLAGRGDLMDTENRFRIVPIVVLLHP